MIREYKNIPGLLRTVVGSDDPDVVLAVAGRPSSTALAEEIRSAAGDDRRVVLDLAFQSDAAMATWLRAADVVVLPYRAIQNSGSAVLALSADRPVVVPALGAMRELQEVTGPAWVRCFDGDFDGRELRASLDWARQPRADRAPIDRLAWNGIARDTVAFYRRVRGDSPAPTPEPIHAAVGR
jgi:beta-1,4-mannosyltransferase